MHLLFYVLDLHAGSGAAGADQRLAAQFWDFRASGLKRGRRREEGTQMMEWQCDGGNFFLKHP